MPADVAFHAVARLLRTAGRLNGLMKRTASTQVRSQFPDADPQDLLLLDDLLGIADPDTTLPKIDPDARRRRLTALINSNQLARTEPAVFIVEDAHWIDEVSESMLVDFLAVIPQTPSLVLITYRPEYQGALAHVAGAQTIALAPLSDAETSALVAELLGPDPSVARIGEMISGRAAGNPFFAEEITRDLAERGVLVGESGSYTCHTDTAQIDVPATLQATIAARIDRLGATAKDTIASAAVIGSRFDPDLLASLGVDPVVDELIAAELVDQVRFTPRSEYAFRHPLIRTVAYESQLRSNRAQLHRRLAAAIETGDPEAANQNAALIAEHLEAAGDLHSAYHWQMRAAAWARNRDIKAARLSWERAQRIADDLPADDPDRTAMRIAPRSMLCGIAFRIQSNLTEQRFEELRELCATAGDEASLALGMAGLVGDYAFRDRMKEASQLASEAWEIADSIGDPVLTVGVAPLAIYGKFENAEWLEMLRWSQTAMDLADGDPAMGDFIIGSPLAVATASRGIARYQLGRSGWADDMGRGLAMARSAEPMCHATVVAWVYNLGIPCGVLSADEPAMREIAEAVHNAERSGDDLATSVARMTLGNALVHRQTDAERARGQQLLAEASDVFVRRGHNLGELPVVDVYSAREQARRGECGDPIPLMRSATAHLFRDRTLLMWNVPVTGVLVEALLDRGAGRDSDGYLIEAQAAIERLAAAPGDGDLAVREIWLLRLRALLARARGDTTAYAGLRDRYRDMANALGFEGHSAWAEAMP